MPLSEYEKRTLDQIEQGLSRADPHPASALGSVWPRRRVGKRHLRAARLLTGVSLLLTGVIAALLGVHSNNSIGLITGVLSYLVIVAAATLTLDAVRRR
jgi:hypothetical protein